MLKNIAGLSIILLSFISTTFSAPKFPFPQQNTYPNGIMPTGVSHTHVQQVYDVWLPNFYEENGNLARIKFDTPSQTVSEGIGYGMLILVYMDNAKNNTQAKFDKLWNYWKNFPSSGSLMHWKISGFAGVVETGSATDGDIDAALALILAYYQWGEERYLTGAKSIMSAIRSNDVSGNILDGGDQWSDINPSYMSMVATELFQKVDAGGGWSGIQSGCYSHLRSTQNQNTGMWPNWTQGGVKDAGLYGFDAARIPWRLGWAYTWYGHSDAKTCCTKIVDWFKQSTGDNPGKIGQIYNVNGTITGSNDNIPTFLGPLVVAGMVDSKYQQWVDDGYKRLRTFGPSNDNYYNECLELLCMLLLSGNMPDLSTAQPKTTAKLTVEVDPPDAGVVTVSPEKSSYSRGDQVSLSVTSKDEDTYEFVSWGGDIDESSESVTVTLDCDMTVIAKFKDVLAMDLVDDCEDNNARTFLKSVWFTFTDGSSSISPNTDESTSFKMTEGGYNSEYAVKIEYSLQGGGQGDPYVGVGFGMTRANDPTDISDATGFRFYYKGSFPDTTVGLKIETDAGVEAGAEHRYFLTPSSSWKEVSLSWDDFLQPKWTKNPSNLDLGSVKLFQWQVQGKGGSGELWLDDIHLVGYYIYRVPVVQQRYAPQNTSCTIIPFSKGYAATYATGRDGMVNCVLYDLCGRQVRNLVSKFMQAGNHSLHIAPDDAQLSNNGYILRLSTVDGTYTKQLIVNR